MSDASSNLVISAEAQQQGWSITLDGTYSFSSVDRFRRVVYRDGLTSDHVIHIHPSAAVDSSFVLGTGGGTTTRDWLLGYGADTIGTTVPNFVQAGDVVEWQCFGTSQHDRAWSVIWEQDQPSRFRSNRVTLPGRLNPPAVTPVETPVSERKKRMSFLGSLETDALWTPMDVNHGTFASTESNVAAVPRVRYPATVHHTIGHFSSRAAVQVGSQRAKSMGLLMVGAGERAPDRTPYRVRGHFFSPALRLQAFYGTAPASPSAAAAGENISDPMMFDAEVGGVLDIDDVIMMAPPATANLGRALVFGIQAVNVTGAAVTGFVAGTMSVQRLVGPPPSFIDRRK